MANDNSIDVEADIVVKSPAIAVRAKGNGANCSR